MQQLANAIGAAVITTIYFGALARGPAHAMTLSLLTVITIGVLSCLAIPLLPRHAQPACLHDQQAPPHLERKPQNNRFRAPASTSATRPPRV